MVAHIKKYIKSLFSKKKLLASRLPLLEVWKEVYITKNKFHIRHWWEHVRIWSYCALWENISIIATNHNINLPAVQHRIYQTHFGKYPWNISKWPIRIGNDVRIGDNVTILSWVEIGDGACIATWSVVTKNVSPYAIVWWVPAKEIKKRFSDDMISYLSEIKRRNRDSKKMSVNTAFFHRDLNKTTVKQLQSILV